MILLDAFRTMAHHHMNRGASRSQLARMCGVSTGTMGQWLRPGASKGGHAAELEQAIVALGGTVGVTGPGVGGE